MIENTDLKPMSFECHPSTFLKIPKMSNAKFTFIYKMFEALRDF